MNAKQITEIVNVMRGSIAPLATVITYNYSNLNGGKIDGKLFRGTAVTVTQDTGHSKAGQTGFYYYGGRVLLGLGTVHVDPTAMRPATPEEIVSGAAALPESSVAKLLNAVAGGVAGAIDKAEYYSNHKASLSTPADDDPEEENEEND